MKCERNSAVKEAEAITARYPVLQPTGCTARFCEGGRMIHSMEPRVGQNRSISVVRREAIDFLSQLRRDGVIPSDGALQRRMVEALKEIDKNSTEASVKLPGQSQKTCRVGGPWTQSRSELEYGLRLAWKHSRRCIMRSQYEDLRLCDLRHVSTSVEMGSVLLEELQKAFNNGDILPTVFVFPPRDVGRPGPMIWNSQLLSFAGYTQNDGTILGDPINVELTKNIIELGWTPPSFRTKWDLLPLVTMAEGETPIITEIPKDLFPLVSISHPNYDLAFEKLALRWVPAAALSRLGFDIGGVQYTATPFIGWFMDAEIGVRDLADRERYNILPQVVESLGWIDSMDRIEELREAEKLRLLSNAQSELNYAVYHSFQQANIRMSDTLTASAMYCSFDDEHLRKYGFRLPADPYWLAPPQGSIIPIWHRGGSPNYQPKPVIARHVQDPIKAWKRRAFPEGVSKKTLCPHSPINSTSLQENVRKIRIYYCSAGTTARKLARRTESRLRHLIEGSQQYYVAPAESLNSLLLRSRESADIILVIASSSGHGEIPANGQEFARTISGYQMQSGTEWAIFGNGNSTYSNSYNGAAKRLHTLLTQRKGKFLVPNYFNGDTAIEDPPWSQLEQWLKDVSIRLVGLPTQVSTEHYQPPSGNIASYLFCTFLPATITSCTLLSSNVRRIVLNVGKAKYEDFMHAQILVPNRCTDVEKVLKTFKLSGREVVGLRSSPLTTWEVFTHFIDLEKPFTHVRWADAATLSYQDEKALLSWPILKTTELFHERWESKIDPTALCAALSLSRPRHFSIAASKSDKKEDVSLEFLVKCQRNGKFSSKFLSTVTTGTSLRIRFAGSSSLSMIKDYSKPIIAFATGSGISPIKYILQQRISQSLSSATSQDEPIVNPSPISVFVGFRPEDVRMVSDALQDAIRSNIVDILSLTPSNPAKWRAQDDVFNTKFRNTIISRIKDESCYVFVCASPEAAKGFSSNLSALLGRDVRDALRERYIEEVFEAA